MNNDSSSDELDEHFKFTLFIADLTGENSIILKKIQGSSKIIYIANVPVSLWQKSIAKYKTTLKQCHNEETAIDQSRMLFVKKNIVLPYQIDDQGFIKF